VLSVQTSELLPTECIQMYVFRMIITTNIHHFLVQPQQIGLSTEARRNADSFEYSIIRGSPVSIIPLVPRYHLHFNNTRTTMTSKRKKKNMETLNEVMVLRILKSTRHTHSPTVTLSEVLEALMKLEVLIAQEIKITWFCDDTD